MSRKRLRFGYVIDTEKQLYGFKAGDIITSQNPSYWHKKRVIVEGFDSTNDLCGVVEGESDLRSHPKREKDLLLLERPGWPFKVGDRVRAVRVGTNLVDTEAEIVALNPTVLDPFNEIAFLIKDTLNNMKGHDGNNGAREDWFPQSLKTGYRHDLWFANSHMLSLLSRAESDTNGNQEKTKVDDKKGELLSMEREVPEMTETMPKWLQEITVNYKAGNNCFILHGNIHDLHKDESGKLLSIYQFLAKSFDQRLVVFYSLSQGAQFANEEAEKKFRKMINKEHGQNTGQGSQDPSSAAAKASQSFNKAMSEAPLDQVLGGKSPEVLFPVFSRILAEKERIVLVVDNCHNIAPNIQSQGMAERVIVETLEYWGRNIKIKEAGNMIVLLSSFDVSLAECLRSLHSGYKSIKIPKPDHEQRFGHWESLIAENGLDFDEGVDSNLLGRITNGLSLRDIGQICSLTKVRRLNLSVSAVKSRKREILKSEFGDLIKIKDPEYGFKYFGGKENAKEYMMEIRDNISKGILRRVPMGLLASGPPGTGKTFFFECWAHECGFNFVHIENPRNMWVGKSEENMLKIFAALDDIAPVVVIEDEADQSEAPRDMPNGDSGVSSRLRKMKFEFCSDPARRGKVIWVRISNRADLIDIAYKRKGRTDDSIPFILPMEGEHEDIFKVMFARYDIPTDISDFSEYANKVAQKIYCAGADIEWMVREADQYAGRENKDKVEEVHLLKAIDDWEMSTDPLEIDRQTIQAICGSSKRLRPANWEDILTAARTRLGIINHVQSGAKQAQSIHSDFGKIGH